MMQRSKGQKFDCILHSNPFAELDAKRKNKAILKNR